VGCHESGTNVMSHSEARHHFAKARMNTVGAVTSEMLDGWTPAFITRYRRDLYKVETKTTKHMERSKFSG
jgi:hypothetical protein